MRSNPSEDDSSRAADGDQLVMSSAQASDQVEGAREPGKPSVSATAGSRRLEERLIALTAITAQLTVELTPEAVVAKAILLRQVVPQIASCAVLLYDKEDGELGVAASVGMPPEDAEVILAAEVDQGLWSGSTTAQPISFPDILLNRRLEALWPLAETTRLRALWTLPLVEARGERVGWVVYGCPAPFSPNAQERTLATLFGNHLVVALRQAQFFEDSQRRVQELSVLHRISTRTGAAVADLDQTLQRLLNEFGELMHPAKGIIALRADDGAAAIRATYNLSKEDRTTGQQVARQAMSLMGEEGAALLVGDARREDTSGLLASSGLRSLLCAPLKMAGRVVGVVIVGDGLPHAYSHTDLRLMSTACNQASTILENALLFAETKRRQEEVATQRRQLAAIFRSTSEGVMIVDHQGTVVAVNPACRRITGYRPAEMIGQKASTFLGIDLARFRPEVASEEAEPKPGERGARVVHPRYVDIGFTTEGGARIDLSVGKTGMATGEGPDFTIVTIRDVSERMQLERMKGDFISTISHDLRTFLTAIKGYAATLQHLEAETAPEQRKLYLGAIDNATNRISNLVSDMLELSRLEAGHLPLHPEELFLDCMAADLVTEAQAQTTAHALRVLPHGPMPLVKADKGRIERVIINLLDNAMKYSPEGGEIEVQIEHLLQRRDLVRRAGRHTAEGFAASPAGWVLVAVQDHGVGVPPDLVHHLFDKFFRVEGELTAKIRGSGLGLYICRAIVEAHGGKIWATSELGQGTTLAFALPAAAPDAGDEDW